MPSVLFVCYANICRSPAAAAIFSHLLQKGQVATEEIVVESCAINDEHLGNPPDARVARALQQRGIPIKGEAKLFKLAYFKEYDYILAVDHTVLHVLRYRARSPEENRKLFLITDFSPRHHGVEIPDPYRFGGSLEELCDLLQECCQELVKYLIVQPPH
jgi:protein-tyrosine phosphatase